MRNGQLSWGEKNWSQCRKKKKKGVGEHRVSRGAGSTAAAAAVVVAAEGHPHSDSGSDGHLSSLWSPACESSLAKR